MIFMGRSGEAQRQRPSSRLRQIGVETHALQGDCGPARELALVRSDKGLGRDMAGIEIGLRAMCGEAFRKNVVPGVIIQAFALSILGAYHNSLHRPIADKEGPVT